MALSRTMGTLIGLCQRRADMENDDHVDSDEWKEIISEVYGELHGAVAETGARYFETEATITADGSASYSLPSDHLSTVGVDFVTDGAGHRRELAELMIQERGLVLGNTGEAFFFAFTGTSIALYPKPSSGTYKHIYVPQPTDYSSVGNGTSIDVICNEGLRFLVWGAAAIALHKAEMNQQRAMAEREVAHARLVEWATRRALQMPKRRIVNEIDIYSPASTWLSPADWRFR